MILETINILKSNNFYAKSERIEIAKGRYKMPYTFKAFIKNIKRQIKWQLKRK